MKLNITALRKGMLIEMLNGVVEVAAEAFPDGDKMCLRINIGTLHNHPMRFDAGTDFNVVSMPSHLAGWYGV